MIVNWVCSLDGLIFLSSSVLKITPFQISISNLLTLTPYTLRYVGHFLPVCQYLYMSVFPYWVSKRALQYSQIMCEIINSLPQSLIVTIRDI